MGSHLLRSRNCCPLRWVWDVLQLDYAWAVPSLSEGPCE